MACLVVVAGLDDAPPWLDRVLAPDERARAAALVVPEAAAGTALARALVRLLAAAALGCEAADVGVAARCPRCAGPHGPPTVAGLGWRWSVSHGGGCVVVAASTDGAPVGVDVERVGTATPPEVAGGLPGWVAVEAVLKLGGDGLTVDPAAVALADGRVRHYPGELPPEVRVRPLEVRPDHVGALATVGSPALQPIDVMAALAASDLQGAVDRLRAELRLDR